MKHFKVEHVTFLSFERKAGNFRFLDDPIQHSGACFIPAMVVTGKVT